MNKREIDRKSRIEELIVVLKENEDSVVNFRKLTYEVMFKYGITKRLAREYLEVAKSQL